MPSQPHDILLVEQSAMVGNIIVSTARQLNMPKVRLVTSIRSAQQQLETQSFSGMITSLEDEAAALVLIQDLRGAAFKSHADTPVAITAALCDVHLAHRLKVLDVRRVLLKPFKIRDVISTIELLTQPAMA